MKYHEHKFERNQKHIHPLKICRNEMFVQKRSLNFKRNYDKGVREWVPYLQPIVFIVHV